MNLCPTMRFKFILCSPLQSNLKLVYRPKRKVKNNSLILANTSFNLQIVISEILLYGK